MGHNNCSIFNTRATAHESKQINLVRFVARVLQRRRANQPHCVEIPLLVAVAVLDN